MKVIGYVGQSSLYSHPPSTMDLSKLSHLIFSGVYVTSSTDLTWGNINSHYLIDQCIQAGKSLSQPITVMASFGGSSWPTDNILAILNNPSLRSQLIDNLVLLVTSHNLDGLDLDWEANYNLDNRRALYDQLVIDLYNRLHHLNKLISVYGGSKDNFSISISTMSYVDFINLGSYTVDYTGCVEFVNSWIQAGYPKDKLYLGCGFYGRDDKNVNVAAWRDILSKFNPSEDQSSATDASVSGGTIYWQSVNQIRSMVEYVHTEHIAGLMIWEIGLDLLAIPAPDKSLLKYISDKIKSLEASMTTIKVSVTLSPKVFEAEFTVHKADNTPISGATVTVKNQPAKVTNSSGIALITPVPAGSNSYTVSHPDYETVTGTFTVS